VSDLSRLKVALVHDWLTGMRGGERVLEALCHRFPHADLFTLLHVPGSVSGVIEDRRIHTSALQHLPGSRRHYRNYLPLFPWLIGRFDFSGFDLVVSSSHCVAKGARAPAGVPHLCYCFTPMRYAWDQFDQYFGPARMGRLSSLGLRPVLSALASWDRATAGRVSRYVTISHYVAGRIRRYYNREATVVYPPVDTMFFQPERVPPDRYALVVSALVPYKRIEVAIDASVRAGIPLKIVGDGPEGDTLRRHAAAAASGQPTAQVEFLGRRSDDEVRTLYQHAAMVLLPGEEDFGIVPVEAQACGRPVVALGRGGGVETVVHGVTGLLVDEPNPQLFAAAMNDAASRTFDPEAIREHAEQFSPERFAREMEHEIDAVLRGAR
jgi:glycosyltransferase involved in cell wall biosynthesis